MRKLFPLFSLLVVLLAACPSDRRARTEAQMKQLEAFSKEERAVVKSWTEVLQVNVLSPLSGEVMPAYRAHVKVALQKEGNPGRDICRLVTDQALLGSAPNRVGTEENPLPHRGIPIWFHSAASETLSSLLAQQLSFTPLTEDDSFHRFALTFRNNGFIADMLYRMRPHYDKLTDQCSAHFEICTRMDGPLTCIRDNWESVNRITVHPDVRQNVNRLDVGRVSEPDNVFRTVSTFRR